MIKLDENKLAKLRTSSEHLTEKYGELGSPEREEFEAIQVPQISLLSDQKRYVTFLTYFHLTL